MEFCERLWSALDAHFDDIEDVRNVADHGCEGGVSGFIYHYELKDFYFTHEDDIETLLDDHDVSYEDIHPRNYPMTVRSCIQFAVWYAVQVYCDDRLMTSIELEELVTA